MANILHEGRLLERYSSHRSNSSSKVLPLHVTKKSTFAEGPPMQGHIKKTINLAAALSSRCLQ